MSYYEEPKNEDHMRLKRDVPKGFTSDKFMGFVFFPGIIGMLVMILMMEIVPTVVVGMTHQNSINRTLDQVFARLEKEFGHLAAMEWGQTNLWAYLLAGALLGIFIRYTYSNDKL